MSPQKSGSCEKSEGEYTGPMSNHPASRVETLKISKGLFVAQNRVSIAFQFPEPVEVSPKTVVPHEGSHIVPALRSMIPGTSQLKSS
jgi:hypothetical protein